MKNVYTVGQVNSYIRNMVAEDFMLQSLFMKGEVSNCKYHSSGHIYFTLKDTKGTIACVMFAGNRSGLSFRLQEGMQVILNGNIDVYERDGKYQFYTKEITLEGDGVQYELFEQLKNKLQEMGMFAPQYKRQIPKFSKKIGVVTAPTGAAIQDIISITARRNPFVTLIIYPAIVQGEQAAGSIIQGIRALEQQQVDVIIVGRGGGSIEDLWAFNKEEVAFAIFNCSIPIISAVGHETDFTIADFVSDLRAPTPSAAAELAVFDYNLWLGQRQAIYDNMQRIINQKIEQCKNKIARFEKELQYLSPKNQVKEKRMYAIQLEERINSEINRKLIKVKHELQLYIQQLKGLSPLDKLNQGLSYISNETGGSISDVSKVKIDDIVSIHLKNGCIQAKVVSKNVIRRE